jgi:hypothetical protein
MMAKQIPLTQGKFAIVDDADYEWLIQRKWYAYDAQKGKGKWYARCSQSVKVDMHRVITNAPKGMDVDHINGNGLDNRRSNLRVCTRTQNQQNIHVTHNKHGYKGVEQQRGGKYRANIYFDGKRLITRGFNTPEEAARAYDKKARELFGEFAWVNFPIKGG